MTIRERKRRGRSQAGPVPAAPVGDLAPSPMPVAPSPMLCTLLAEPFDDPEWVFEPKFDGLRILARFDGRDLTLLSRNLKPQEARFPEIVAALRESLTQPAIVDGEVVCLGEDGRSSFRALQQRFHLDDPAEIRRRMERHPAYLYLFDLLYLDRYDVTRLPLGSRKALLRESVSWSDRVRWTDFVRGDGIEAWRRACARGDEGIVGKRLDSLYVPGRSDAWVKVKCVGRQEFVIGGWTDPQRSRVGLGALLVGYYDDAGARLCYAGKVGTGYTRETLLDLRCRLDALAQGSEPFDEGNTPGGDGVHWVQPRLVAEVGFAEWSQNGLLRQPRFEGLRPDKAPRECRRERPKPLTAIESVGDARSSPAPDAPRPGGSAMPLEEYNAKRDFSKTREPAGADAESSHKRPIFVVQEHHASHLHYDFRLEADGVLKSWAVPKGPPLEPGQKRLAVQVEDHPLSYATFEGTIPEGQYGGGTVSIWDHGTYENRMGKKAVPQTVSEAIDAGRLEFTLHGEKLRGNFALVRMNGRGRDKPQWLLIKLKDEAARAETAAEGPKTTRKSSGNDTPAAVPARRTRAARPPKEIEVTHPEKVLFPEAGLTKGDVLAYYDRIADRLLPFLKDRPATLERLPEGLSGEGAPHFWQKDTPDYYPDWIPRVALPTERGKTVRYALVNNRQTLLYLVNQGTVTFHVWGSRVGNLDVPDFVLFDLDPGKAPFAQLVEVALAVHSELEEEGVKSYVKTSGKTGLHVLTPWRNERGYDEARAWALKIAGRVAESMPARATVEIRKAKRNDRVYIDVLQNARGHHAVPPYVLRAVPAATISTPLRWEEVTPELDPAAFTPKTIFRRLSHLRRDPFAGLLPPSVSRRPRAVKTR